MDDSTLNHIAEPADPTDRDADVVLEDYVALWFSNALMEFAHYGDHDSPEQHDIARGYVEHIETAIRRNGDPQVYLYAHTSLAEHTLIDALLYYRHTSHQWYPVAVDGYVEDELCDLFADDATIEDHND